MDPSRLRFGALILIFQKEKSSKVNMASSELSAIVLGRMTNNLSIQEQINKKLLFGVIPNPCADVLGSQKSLCRFLLTYFRPPFSLLTRILIQEPTCTDK